MNEFVYGGARASDARAPAEEGGASALAAFPLGENSPVLLHVEARMFRVLHLGPTRLRCVQLSGDLLDTDESVCPAELFTLSGTLVDRRVRMVSEVGDELTAELEEPLHAEQLSTLLSSVGLFAAGGRPRLSRAVTFYVGAQAVHMELSRLLFLGAALLDPESRRICGKVSALKGDAFGVSLEGVNEALPNLVLVETHGRQLILPCREISGVTGRRWARLPPWVAAVPGRAAHRAPPRLEVMCSLSRPFDSERRAPAYDLSATGFSIQTTEPAHFPPGLSLEVEVRAPRQEPVLVKAWVRHATWTSTDLVRIGFQIEPSESFAQWSRLLAAAVFPDLRVNSGECWLMYQRSGYLSLSGKKEGEFDELKSSYEDVAAKLVAAPELACFRRWPSRGAPVCAIAHARVYEHTWFLYQVAKDKESAEAAGGGRVGLYRLYLQAYEHVLSHASTEFLWSFVQEEASPWSLFFHRDVPLRVCEGAYTYMFRALECRAGRASLVSPGRYLHESRVPSWVKRLESFRPPTYLRALDLADAGEAFGRLRGEWRAHELQRERAWFVVGRSGQECLLALVELAPPGLHLYGLLDSLRVYALQELSSNDLRCAQEMAAAWFERRGRRKFVWQVEEDLMHHEYFSSSPEGTNDMGCAHGSIVPRSELPRILDVIHQKLESVGGAASFSQDVSPGLEARRS